MDNVRVAVYGAGGHAVDQHIPTLLENGGADIVAVCDIDEEKARAAAAQFDIPAVYTDGLAMIEGEQIDALWSLVLACPRPTVEVAAAEKGIHLFCDKPQTLEMKAGLEIDAALQRSGALSTVCFRERYRPFYQEAKRLLADKEVAHIRFQSIQRLPTLPPADDWPARVELTDNFLGWAPHAIDYSRFVSGLDVVRVQSFAHQPDEYHYPLSMQCNYLMSNGATMTLSFLHVSPASPPREPQFLFYYEGGYVALHHGYRHVEMNGETVYEAEEFQPWRELDRIFIEAIRTGDSSHLLNDFNDGLLTLAPLLASIDSARQGGVPIDIADYIKG